MGYLLRIFAIVVSFSVVQSVNRKVKIFTNVTYEQYLSLPTLFHLDEFDGCLALKENPFYCYTTFEFEPIKGKNGVSETWKIIEELNTSPRFYRHERLRHGICVPKTCPNISPTLFNAHNQSKELWDGIAKCYNEKYKSYGLRGRVVKAQCQTNEHYYEVDTFDIIYAYIIFVIALTLILGTAYDVYARNYPEDYDKLTRSAIGKFLVSFSIPKNWDRLRADSGTEDGKMLAPINGIRVYNMYFVTSCHTAMLTLMGPVYNPIFVEEIPMHGHNAVYSNGSLTCQTYFVISGLLVSISLCSIFEKKHLQLKHIIPIYFSRFIRLAPLLLLSIGFSASWLRHLGQGPMWQHVVDDEFNNCRKNWIYTLLFVNNYVDTAHICLQQTWNLSADTQTFVAGLFVMMLVLRYPKHAMKIFVTFIVLGVLGTFIQHYYFEYDIVFRSYSETFYTLFLEYEQWLTMFAAGHHHLPAYVLGLACGYYYRIYRRENRKFITNKLIYAIFLVIAWTVPIGVIVIAANFYADGYEYTRLSAALYQSLNRLIFALPIACLIFSFINGDGGILRKVCAWVPVQIMGRLSYSVYLLHVIPLRIRAGQTRQPIYVSTFLVVMASLGDFFSAYILGTIGCLFVEMPITALMKPSKPVIVEKEKNGKKIE